MNDQCPSDYFLANSFFQINHKFYIGRIPATKRHGLHRSLFKQLLFGFMLGDGWLEKHGNGVRLAIRLT
jgi:hypothetical protein